MLLPGLRKLGLDPNDVKLVLLAHGHADHFGGASYFQQRGARVALSAADWDLMQNPPATPPPSAAPSTAAPSPPPANAPSPSSATALPPPRRDLVVIDGQPLELGGLIDHARLDPRSHAGLARLRVQGRGRRPSAHGGAVRRLDLALVADTGRRARAVRAAPSSTSPPSRRRLGVDVEIQNHPLYDGFEAKLAQLKARKPGAAHPFVVGADGYQSFLTVMGDCARVELERRKDATR